MHFFNICLSLKSLYYTNKCETYIIYTRKWTLLFHNIQIHFNQRMVNHILVDCSSSAYYISCILFLFIRVSVSTFIICLIVVTIIKFVYTYKIYLYRYIVSIKLQFDSGVHSNTTVKLYPKTLN